MTKFLTALFVSAFTLFFVPCAEATKRKIDPLYEEGLPDKKRKTDPVLSEISQEKLFHLYLSSPQEISQDAALQRLVLENVALGYLCPVNLDLCFPGYEKDAGSDLFRTYVLLAHVDKRAISAALEAVIMDKSEEGDADALLCKGLLLDKGYSRLGVREEVKQDLSEARRCYLASVAKGGQFAKVHLTEMLCHHKDPDADKFLVALREEESLKAQYVYFKHTRSLSLEEKMKELKKIAKKGCVQAQCDVAESLKELHDDAVFQKSFDLYVLAANCGSARACYGIGDLLKIKSNPEICDALAWHEEGIKIGQRSLGRRSYFQTNDEFLSSLYCYLEAAKIYRSGWVKEDGTYCTPNKNKAMEYRLRYYFGGGEKRNISRYFVFSPDERKREAGVSCERLYTKIDDAYGVSLFLSGATRESNLAVFPCKRLFCASDQLFHDLEQIEGLIPFFQSSGFLITNVILRDPAVLASPKEGLARSFELNGVDYWCLLPENIVAGKLLLDIVARLKSHRSLHEALTELETIKKYATLSPEHSEKLETILTYALKLDRWIKEIGSSLMEEIEEGACERNRNIIQ